MFSRGEYGVPEGICFGFPVEGGAAGWHVVEGLEHDPAARKRIDATLDELQQEKALVADLLG